MPSANKDRKRVTLHVDKELYALLQKKSKVDQKPISRIFDEAISPLVEPFKYSTPEDWEIVQMERAHEKHITQDNFDAPSPSQGDKELAEISKVMMKAKDEETRIKAFSKMQELMEDRKNKDEYRQRWIKYCSE